MLAVLAYGASRWGLQVGQVPGRQGTGSDIADVEQEQADHSPKKGSPVGEEKKIGVCRLLEYGEEKVENLSASVRCVRGLVTISM